MIIDIETPEEKLLEAFFEAEEDLRDILCSYTCPGIVWDETYFEPTFRMNLEIPNEETATPTHWDWFHSNVTKQLKFVKDIKQALKVLRECIPYLGYYGIRVSKVLKTLPDALFRVPPNPPIETLSFNLTRPIKRPKRRAHRELMKKVNAEDGAMFWIKTEREVAHDANGTSIVVFSDFIGPTPPGDSAVSA